MSKKLSKTVVKEAKNRINAGKLVGLSMARDHKKRGLVTRGTGIRPQILETLLRAKAGLKRNDIAVKVEANAPSAKAGTPKSKKVNWSLGSMNIALGVLVKERFVSKEKEHGGKFKITNEGRAYAKKLRVLAA